jgi:isopentenyldiphosphate isomerase
MEYLDVVDDSDQVVGKAPISEIYEKKLLHRIVHILIFNNEGKLALQLRSEHKSFCPLHWSTPVGGHVQSGETYMQGALREFKEELGMEMPIEFLYRDVYDDDRGLKKFLETFKVVFDGPFKVNLEEVIKVEYFTMAEIQRMIEDGGKFHPELLFLLRKHYGLK